MNKADFKNMESVTISLSANVVIIPNTFLINTKYFRSVRIID